MLIKIIPKKKKPNHFVIFYSVDAGAKNPFQSIHYEYFIFNIKCYLHLFNSGVNLILSAW